MSDSDDPALWYALRRLVVDYWADVDQNAGNRAHEFYLPEALYAVGNNRFEGAEKIRAFYARRRQFGNSTTRHLVGNIRVLAEDAGGCPGLGGDEPLPRRWPPAGSDGKAARDDRRFRGALRACR